MPRPKQCAIAVSVTRRINLLTINHIHAASKQHRRHVHTEQPALLHLLPPASILQVIQKPPLLLTTAFHNIPPRLGESDRYNATTTRKHMQHSTEPMRGSQNSSATPHQQRMPNMPSATGRIRDAHHTHSHRQNRTPPLSSKPYCVCQRSIVTFVLVKPSVFVFSERSKTHDYDFPPQPFTGVPPRLEAGSSRDISRATSCSPRGDKHDLGVPPHFKPYFLVFGRAFETDFFSCVVSSSLGRTYNY